MTLAARVAVAQVRQRASFAFWRYLLGVWRIGICFMFGNPDGLLLGSVKGLLIVVLTWPRQATRMMTSRY